MFQCKGLLFIKNLNIHVQMLVKIILIRTLHLYRFQWCIFLNIYNKSISQSNKNMYFIHKKD